MKIEKLLISKDKLDINLKFYFFLKLIVKIKPSEKITYLILENFNLYKDLEVEIIREKFYEILSGKKGGAKKNLLSEVILRLNDEVDLTLFIFAIKLLLIKDLLLQEAKISHNIELEKLSKLDPLSLEYDEISAIKPYSTRVSGSLLALLFFEKLENKEFNFMSSDSQEFLKNLAKTSNALKDIGLEPNQIFMLMFTESINQSIISDSGSNFEDRILAVLTKNDVKDISKEHDKNDKSTEFDFFFTLKGKTFGIGAKRTLRERYKQFIKTAQMSKIDVMIEITLGLDLNESKAQNIINHGIYIFVANEVYDSRDFMQKSDKIFPARDLNLKNLLKLA